MEMGRSIPQMVLALQVTASDKRARGMAESSPAEFTANLPRPLPSHVVWVSLTRFSGINRETIDFFILLTREGLSSDAPPQDLLTMTINCSFAHRANQAGDDQDEWISISIPSTPDALWPG
jgi:hypothetical protein